MTDLIYDYISMGVDMLITAAIISAVVVLLRSTMILNTYSANQQASSERINYYKEYNKYDCTETLVTADIISAMLYYRYDLQVCVKMKDGTIYTNKPSSDTVINGTIYKVVSGATTQELTSVDFRNSIASNWKFRAFLYEDARTPDGNFTPVSAENGATDLTLPGFPSVQGYEGGLITGLYFEAVEQIYFD